MELGKEKCAACGKEFKKTGLAQKYCSKCGRVFAPDSSFRYCPKCVGGVRLRYR